MDYSLLLDLCVYYIFAYFAREPTVMSNILLIVQHFTLLVRLVRFDNQGIKTCSLSCAEHVPIGTVLLPGCCSYMGWFQFLVWGKLPRGTCLLELLIIPRDMVFGLRRWSLARFNVGRCLWLLWWKLYFAFWAWKLSGLRVLALVWRT